jgi:superfamily II RNA helicase
MTKSRFPRGSGRGRQPARGRRGGAGSKGKRPGAARGRGDRGGARPTGARGGSRDAPQGAQAAEIEHHNWESFDDTRAHAALEPVSLAGAPTTFRGYFLNPFQRQAAAAIQQGRSVVVAAPTGAGKTLVAEIAIAETIARGNRVIYTSPIKALSNQKYRDFKAAAGSEVGILTGDVAIHADAPLVIMTTEILRNEIFDSPERLRNVEVVIFDEVHYLDDPDRGTVWEEAILFAPSNIRFVALSATIPNLNQFVGWMREARKQKVEQVESQWRPVPLHHYCYHPAVGEFDVRRIHDMRRRVGRRGAHRGAFDIAKNLLTALQQDKELPVLWFCFSRRDCEQRARRNAWRNLLVPSERKKIEEMFDETCALFQQEIDGELVELRGLAAHGIGYHHAGMLPIHKEIVERLFTSGLLKLLFTTETFAMGVNMPAKTVVFNSLRKFNGIEFDWLRTRDYMQMAGRAGRQGIDEVGKVVSVFDTEDLHDAPIERIVFGELEPVRSRFNLNYGTLLRLLVHLKGRIEEAWERSFNRYQFETSTEDRRERNRERQLDLLRRKLDFLHEIGFHDEHGVTDRGKIASKLSAYEVQFADCFFRGIFEDLTPRELAAAFVGIVYEERKGETLEQSVPLSFAPIKRKINDAVRSLKQRETSYKIPEEIKRPDFSLTDAVYAWCDGSPMDALERHTTTAPGDLVRTFRVAVQCIRNMSAVLRKAYALSDRLAEAMRLLNRDEVDAQRQLELGGVEVGGEDGSP